MIIYLLEVSGFKLLTFVGDFLHSLSPVIQLESGTNVRGFFFTVAIVIQQYFNGL